MSQPLNILFPNGQVEAVQMYVWDGTKPALWTGNVSTSGITLPRADSVYATYPTALIDVFTFKLATVTVGTMTVTYQDTDHEIFLSAVLT